VRLRAQVEVSALRCGDGVGDRVDGSLAGRVVRDDLPRAVADIVEDGREVLGGLELDELDVVASGPQRRRELLRLPGRADGVVVAVDEVDVGGLVAPVRDVVEPRDRLAVELVVAAGQTDDDVGSWCFARAPGARVLPRSFEAAQEREVGPE
jgi:hypothetical protein